MTPKTKHILITILCTILGFAAGIAVVKGNEKARDFDRLMDAREAAPDKEEFDQNFENMAEWLETYKRENPGATDEDAARAFEALWENR